ncbi:thyroid transcription factor 1-associated protein 26 [Pelodiscus sinensis]|uniref:thyroid transcription factor 1-associated protein 26 n=1 Tax=Pelodiscus sinensis TaxID=13735 RepID=UPI003F6B4E6D
MAPVAARRGSAPKKNTATARDPRRKRPWRPDPRQNLLGNVREGQGFAFWRKQKIQQEYKKLLKKERKAHTEREVKYTDTYPDHLKHLYLAEEELLEKQSKNKRALLLLGQKYKTTVKSDRTQREFKKKTSNQKAKEEYEKVKAERAKKKEAAEKRKQEREEAQRLYKQKKMEAFKILSKRTKKGQPNLNLQIEFLLQKIQQKT